MTNEGLLAVFFVFFGIPINAYLFYSAWKGEKWAVIAVCIGLAMHYVDAQWKDRKSSSAYAFLEGLRGKDTER